MVADNSLLQNCDLVATDKGDEKSVTNYQKRVISNCDNAFFKIGTKIVPKAPFATVSWKSDVYATLFF